MHLKILSVKWRTFGPGRWVHQPSMRDVEQRLLLISQQMVYFRLTHCLHVFHVFVCCQLYARQCKHNNVDRGLTASRPSTYCIKWYLGLFLANGCISWWHLVHILISKSRAADRPVVIATVRCHFIQSSYNNRPIVCCTFGNQNVH